MANLSSGFMRSRSMTQGLRELCARVLTGGAGVVLFTGSLLLLLVLATYDPTDPSWNVATDKVPANIGGPYGAIIADTLVQTVGYASVLLPLVLAVWSLRLLLNLKVRHLWLRAMLLPVLLLLGAVSLGILPHYAGGVAGRLAWEHFPLESYAFVPAMAVAALFGVLLSYVLGLSSDEWREVRRTTVRVARAGGKAGIETIRKRTTAVKPTRPREVSERDKERLTRLGLKREPQAPARTPPGAPRALAPDIVASKPQAPPPGKRSEQAKQPMLALEPEDTGDYSLPPLDLLEAPPPLHDRIGPSEEALQQNALLLLSVLEDFGVKGEIVKVRPGPVVTLYELEPAPGTKSSRVIGLADDIARSMSAISVRVAVVPGRNVIGIELPNTRAETVYLRELLAAEAYERNTAKLPLILGKDIGGAPVMADLAKMPHLLIAGTTGSGKSVGINTMILSILYRMQPSDCKFIMIDPKMLELSIYDGIPHLLTPVVTDPKKAVVALKWTVREMGDRYRKMSRLGVRNIEGYNQRLREAAAKGENLARSIQTGFDGESGEPIFEEQVLDTNPLPFIVVVVDEMADLMLVAGKDIEAAIQRLAQMARAAGIHIIMATQRPSVDVITGTIKANFPTRISFQVTSKIDSRTILGESGAEQLLGRGDMLYMAGGGRITRVHGPFVADNEVEAIVGFLKSQGSPDYVDEVTVDDGNEAVETGTRDEAGSEAGNELYDKAVALVTRERKASTSFVQRHLQIGYNRAARIMEQMEQQGVVSQANHVGKRQVLAPPPR